MSDKAEQKHYPYWFYVPSVMDTPDGDKPCFDVCKQISKCTGQFVFDVVDEDEAKLVVNSVNNHYKLVEALEEIKGMRDVTASIVDFIENVLAEIKQ